MLAIAVLSVWATVNSVRLLNIIIKWIKFYRWTWDELHLSLAERKEIYNERKEAYAQWIREQRKMRFDSLKEEWQEEMGGLKKKKQDQSQKKKEEDLKSSSLTFLYIKMQLDHLDNRIYLENP